ncbi:MAG: hypothetical protein ACTSVU_04720 [Promethearchaeota archaeon]
MNPKTSGNRKNSVKISVKNKNTGKKTVVKKTKNKKSISKEISTKSSSEEKNAIVARNLLRIYNFMNNGAQFKEEKLIEELELNTPNQKLRERINQVELELKSIFEENSALHQNALQSQIEFEDKYNAQIIENQELQIKLTKVNETVKDELAKVAKKYETVISELKTELKKAKKQNEHFLEVNEAIEMLQKKLNILGDENDDMAKGKRELQNQLDLFSKEIESLKNQVMQETKKNKELQKKTDLQKIVIDGYKRKEKNSISENPV